MTTPEETEFVGYGPASEYLGLKRNTLSSYVARGIGPTVRTDPATGEKDLRVEGQYVLPVFTRGELDRWMKERPGQGARTDLVQAAA